MTDPIAVALVTAFAALATTVLALLGAELVRLRRRVDAVETVNKKLWAYCLKLRDHIYRGKGPPPPEPDDLDDLFPTQPKE